MQSTSTKMEIWLLILILNCIPISTFLLFKFIFLIRRNLPPGPGPFICFELLLALHDDFANLEPILRSIRSKFGAIFTLYFGFMPLIFIANHSLAHQALVQTGALFADRPQDFTVVVGSNQIGITTGSYGPTWRLLCCNLALNILHPLRLKSNGHARKWALQILDDRLQSHANSGHPVPFAVHSRFSLFALLAIMCFGDKLDEKQIKQIKTVQDEFLSSYRKYSKLNISPSLAKIFMRRQWDEFFQIRKNQEDALIPLIKARKKFKEEKNNKENKDEFVLLYVDTLLDLELPDKKRKLNDEEIVSLCSEFLNAGSDTTSTTLEWIMANLVKYPQIQEQIIMEMKRVMKDGEEEVKEDDLQKMQYLKAVILEGLRRHPPGHFALPHAVTEDVVLNNKYLIPKNTVINFLLADIGLDPKAWEDPLAFKPERFLNINGAFDITGSKEIKMIPFGAGRRMCPAYGFAMLLLEYFVANLIWKYQWKLVDGDDIDFSDKSEFTVVMKNPLLAQISTRFI